MAAENQLDPHTKLAVLALYQNEALRDAATKLVTAILSTSVKYTTRKSYNIGKRRFHLIVKFADELSAMLKLVPGRMTLPAVYADKRTSVRPTKLKLGVVPEPADSQSTEGNTSVQVQDPA